MAVFHKWHFDARAIFIECGSGSGSGCGSGSGSGSSGGSGSGCGSAVLLGGGQQHMRC